MHADRTADRQAETSDKAFDATDEAIDRFREDLRAMGARLVSREWVEVPVMRPLPKDVAILLDRPRVLLERPSRTNASRDISVRSELAIDALNQIAELTPHTNTIAHVKRT